MSDNHYELNGGKAMRNHRWCSSAAAAALLTAGLMASQAWAAQPGDLTANPYAPRFQHPYRHGAVPTREAADLMAQWAKAHGGHGGGGASKILAYGGGVTGIGVVSGKPRVYLVFWGSQWNTSSGDPDGAAQYLTDVFNGIGTGGEMWSGTMTQYCDGPGVSQGMTSCPSAGATQVGYPSGGALAGVWYDSKSPAPSRAKTGQIAAEAVAAAAYFGNTTASANRYVMYLVVSPSGTSPDGFGHANFCAWHDYTTSSYGPIAYTNMPYVDDLGASCGQNFVNSGPLGVNDGFSIVAGHEYAETLTDMLPAGGWTNPSTGEENGDECAWISPGQLGGAADVSMGNGAYAMQSTWSNDTNACEISHEVVN